MTCSRIIRTPYILVHTYLSSHSKINRFFCSVIYIIKSPIISDERNKIISNNYNIWEYIVMEILFRKKSVVFRCMCLIFQMFFFEQLNLGIISMYLFYLLKQMEIIEQSLILKFVLTIDQNTLYGLIQIYRSTYLHFVSFSPSKKYLFV